MLKPLGDRVVLKQVIQEESTKSSILLPSSVKEKPSIAEIVAVGPGGSIDGKEIIMNLKIGDKVIYSKHAAIDVKYEGTEYSILKESDILAIVE